MSMIARIKKHLRLAATIALVLVVTGSQQVAAFTENDFQCANQGNFGGTCFFEQCSGSSTGTTGTGSPPSGGSASGETTGPPKAVQQVVWDTLTNGGIDDLHAAAVMGNIAHEGGFIPENSSENPDAPNRSKDPTVTGLGYGYGLIGWTPGQSLLDQMKELGMASDPPYTAETQAAVILAQIQGKTSVYDSSVGQAFLNTKTIEDATTAYQGNANPPPYGPGGPYLGFERPQYESGPSGSIDQRIASAKHFQQEYGGSGGSGTTTSGGGGSGASSCCPTTGSSGASTTNVNDVYILGDSITERATSAYKQAFQKAGVSTVDVDASVSRGINTPGTDGNKLSGLGAINHDEAEIQQADTVVVALGTNDGATTQDIDNVTDAIQAINPNASVYWVNVISVGRKDNFNQTITGPTNQAINQQAQTDGYQVVNWFKTVDPSGSPTSPTQSEQDPNSYIDNSDGLGVHPTDAGSQALAKLVVSSVGADQNSSTAASSDACCPADGSAPIGAPVASGTISPDVGKGMTSDAQTKFQQILVAAGQKFNIDPNYLAAFYFEENNTNQLSELQAGTAVWREPAPPYGNGRQYAPPHNGGVTGPFQIQQGNVAADGVDGNGDGKIDLDDLTDAAFTAANYLKKSGASVSASDAKLYAAALSYNHADWYATIIMNIYKFLSGGGQSTVSGSGGSCSSASGDASGLVAAAVQAAQALSACKLPYQWGGFHVAGALDVTDCAQLKSKYTGADCSGSTSWVLHQAGMFPGNAAIQSGAFSTWGQAGQGAEMTVWENPTHVFIEFNVPGLGHYEMNTANGSGGPRFIKWGDDGSMTDTSGFTPRHYQGT